MAGYAQAAPLAAGGPWGWAAWAVVGTGLTLGPPIAAWYMSRPSSGTRERDRARADATTTTCETCKRYGLRIHAQGRDVGGTSGSTIGAPGQTKSTPFTVEEGLAMSAQTKGMLGRRQLSVRETAIARAENYIRTGPQNGGRFGLKSFQVQGEPGGVRYDVDVFGDGNSFLA